MNPFIQRVAIPIHFPSGVRMGAGKTSGNLLAQSRDGQGQFVLRGTALAGALRHALEATFPETESGLADWFGGSQYRQEDLVSSRIKFSDCRLQVGSSAEKGVRIRTHNAIDRHRGAPIDGGLFSMESLPPGTATTLVITVESTREESEDAKRLLQNVVGLFDRGITLGGSAARGIGRAVKGGSALWKAWDLSNLDQHADWLDECFQRKRSNQPLSGEDLAPEAIDRKQLAISLNLAVPRGQDFVVADGQGLECGMEPQRVTTADGTIAWLLPGSTLRGLFRAWTVRLAARSGKPVADSHQRWQKRNAKLENVESLMGDDLAFGFASDEERADLADDPDKIECPVMRLFGSGFAKGRIHIADAVSKKQSKNDIQKRVHVAIDRFSGGANEGFLFDNETLTRGSFTVELSVQDPTQEEAEWVAGCIRALDMGLIRVGSSKGAGRLALEQSPAAHGPNADIIETVKPMEVHCG